MRHWSMTAPPRASASNSAISDHHESAHPNARAKRASLREASARDEIRLPSGSSRSLPHGVTRPSCRCARCSPWHKRWRPRAAGTARRGADQGPQDRKRARPLRAAQEQRRLLTACPLSNLNTCRQHGPRGRPTDRASDGPRRAEVFRSPCASICFGGQSDMLKFCSRRSSNRPSRPGNIEAAVMPMNRKSCSTSLR